MKNALLFIFALALFACSTGTKKKSANTQQAPMSYHLEKLWESDTLVRTPESVLLDRQRNILYVSNVNENPWELDGNGFISKMDKDGNIIDLKWIVGLNAPKGMGISGNSLFIADVNALVEANIETGEIIQKIELDGKPDLNDITTANDGSVYVSGSGSVTIYKLNDKQLTPIFTGKEGERFNGLFWEKERMLLLTSNSSIFYEIPWSTMEAKILAENMGHGDGIAPVGDGSYILSNWKGAINLLTEDGQQVELLNTLSDEINAADIDFCVDDQILYVPTFFNNRVVAYKFVKK
ncbi:hypothetical protein [uncultured Draconibacterium sp.]|uniref:hypothetical protein n=1 Tax=uncultured Draconibacterium sp. TaxID=1573823 RepID=UPI0025D41DEA|nr:hypothetical protein [uncultured Draconibacterium sp.]